MAIKGLSMGSTTEYVSKLDPAKGSDRELEDGTVFVLGTMSSRVQAAIKDKATAFRQDPDSKGVEDADPEMIAEFRPNESVYLTVQFGLRGWRHFLDDAGNEIKFETVKRQLGGQTYDVVAPACMDSLGLELARELSDRITKLNEPEKAEAKS